MQNGSLAIAVGTIALLTGCSTSFLGGAATGAAGSGAVYEYSNKRQIEDLEREYERGRIDEDEYERRRREIEERSLLY